jgi:hypothetical protein
VERTQWWSEGRPTVWGVRYIIDIRYAPFNFCKVTRWRVGNRERSARRTC